jgi:beta-glucosidase
LAFQVIQGMQGDDPRYALMNAGVKHFAAFDGPGNGGNAIISDADWFWYLHPFRRAFEAGALSTMCTYAKLNGVYGCENPKLMDTWLRGEMNFSGYVVSDQGGIHNPASALNAGCDIEDG